MNDIVKTIFDDSSLTLSNKETIIIREILDVIISVEFSDAFYDEVVVRILRVYKHLFKNKYDVDKEIAALCQNGLITEKTVDFISGNEIKVSRWHKVLSLNKKISKGEMDDIITSLVMRGFPET